MANKVMIQVENIGEGTAFVLRKVESESGKVRDAETYHSDDALADKEVGGFLQDDYKKGETRRKVWLTMLAGVLGMERVQGYKGKGDVNTGKTSPEFRNAVRECESEYLRKLEQKGFIKLHAGKDENPDEVFQRFATSVREDKNYSNAKATVMKYFAFVGQSPVTKAGKLVPVPVMQALIQQVLEQHRKPTDNSYAAKIRNIMAEMEKDKNIPAEDAAAAHKEAIMLAATLKGIVDHYAELATHAAAAAQSIAKQADKVIANAAKDAGKHKPVTKAEAQTTKD